VGHDHDPTCFVYRFSVGGRGWRRDVDGDLRSSIGFDHFLRVLDRAVKSQHHVDNPPYNIEKFGDDAYRLTVAVAGWTAAEITITAAPPLLVVSGRKTADGKRYLYRGISSGSFEHRFDGDLSREVDRRAPPETEWGRPN